MTAPTLPNLHDAVLERLHVDWAAATATLELQPVPGPACVLIAYGIHEVRVDRWEPWGPSAFVNSAEIQEAASGHVRLRLEMQSGDDILIAAEQLEVTQPDQGHPARTPTR